MNHSIKVTHETEKELFEKYMNGLINDIEYFGELNKICVTNLNNIKLDSIKQKNEVDSYLYN